MDDTEILATLIAGLAVLLVIVIGVIGQKIDALESRIKTLETILDFHGIHA